MRQLNAGAALIDDMAAEVRAHVASRGIVDLSAAQREPFDAVAADTSIRIHLVDAAKLPPGCPVAGCCYTRTQPARLLIARADSKPREAFSLLHEYCHYVIADVDQVADILWDAGPLGGALEEDVCNAFAASVLLPAHEVQAAFKAGVTAETVRLFLQSSRHASREACCTAAASQLPEAGYVMLCDPVAVATFTARHGNVPAIPRLAPQSSSVVRAALASGAAQGYETVSLSDGVAGPSLFVDAVRDGPSGGYAIAVWTTTR